MNSYVQSLLNIPFYAGTRGNRQRVLQYIVQTATNSLLLSRENKKKLAISDILKAIPLELNIITRQMTPFFSSNH